MALTDFQRELIQRIAANRKAGGESYVAGGVALNTLLKSNRLSRDVDLFHDTRDSVHRSFVRDRTLLEDHGYSVDTEIERDGFVEAVARKAGEECRLQWTQDSAFRFFPLIEHAEMGLTLHPFDLATNKVLALVGRAEPRDWVDTILCNDRLQPLGYLAWAAAGKDPGLNPLLILDEAARSRYTDGELSVVEFIEGRPSAAELSERWKTILIEAKEVVSLLPTSDYGACVHDNAGNLVRLDPAALALALATKTVCFHAGSMHGAFPKLLDP